MYLLDTNIISKLFKKGQDSLLIKENLKTKFTTSTKLELYTSVICYQEILVGIKEAERKNGKLYKKTEFDKQIEFLNKELQIIDYSIDTAKKFASINSKINKLGKPIQEFDLMIAATAIEAELILVTNNTKHFENIPGLLVEDWTQPEKYI